jgi:hypothetical protein
MCPSPAPVLSQVNPIHANRNPLPDDSSTPIYAWGFQVVSFRRVPPPKPCINLSPIRATCSAHLILLDLINRILFVEQYRSLSSSLCSSLHPCYIVPLRPKYSSQHPILKHPEPAFLPQCELPRFIHINPIDTHTNN